MRAWVNGSLLDDPETPAVAVTDHGFTVGDGVFEAVKIVDGQPFALTRHLDRLARSARGHPLALPRPPAPRAGSARALGLPEPNPDKIREAAREVLSGEPLELGRVR